MYILDIAPGKKWQDWVDKITPDDTVVCVDNGFQKPTLDNSWFANPISIERKSKIQQIKLNSSDIFEFLQIPLLWKFNKIVSERFFEHLDEHQILYLLYLLYESSAPGAKLKIVVPNIQMVIQRYGELDPESMTPKELVNGIIACTTETFNETADPHRSIWTMKMGRYWIEMEDYWIIDSIRESVTLDNRNWYIEFNAIRR